MVSEPAAPLPLKAPLELMSCLSSSDSSADASSRQGLGLTRALVGGEQGH